MQRGEIYFIDFDPTHGREQAGFRPALVVSADQLNGLPLVVVVIPGTDAANVRRPFPSNVFVPATETGLPLDTVFLGLQIRAVDHSRFQSAPVCRLTAQRMKEVDDAVRLVLDL